MVDGSWGVFGEGEEGTGRKGFEMGIKQVNDNLGKYIQIVVIVVESLQIYLQHGELR